MTFFCVCGKMAESKNGKKRNRATRNNSTAPKGNWYSGALYKGEISVKFSTFALNKLAKSPNFFSKHLKELCPNHKNECALEIGPGSCPILHKGDFRELFFLEQSESLAKNILNAKVPVGISGNAKSRVIDYRLFSELISKDPHVLVGELSGIAGNNLSFWQGKKFGLIAMTEVLTHIPSQHRLEAVKRVSKMSDALLIIDRPEEDIPCKLTSDWKKIGLNEGEEKEQRKMHVSFKPIIGFLESTGWSIEAMTLNEFDARYLILKCRKMPNNS